MNAQCTCLFMLSENKQIKDRGYQLMLSFYQLARGPLTFFECGPLVHLFEYPCSTTTDLYPVSCGSAKMFYH